MMITATTQQAAMINWQQQAIARYLNNILRYSSTPTWQYGNHLTFKRLRYSDFYSLFIYICIKSYVRFVCCKQCELELDLGVVIFNTRLFNSTDAELKTQALKIMTNS